MENNETKFLIYDNPNGKVRVDVIVEDETIFKIWISTFRIIL